MSNKYEAETRERWGNTEAYENTYQYSILKKEWEQWLKN